MATNFIGVLLANSPTYTVSTGFSTQLYDAYGDQTINVQTGASLSLLGSMGANTVRLSGNASAWQVYRDGSTAMLVNTDGSRIELAANTTEQTLQFDDRSLGLSINTSGGAPAVVLGSQTLGTAAVAIEGAGGTPTPPTTPEVGSAVKAPWTLLMSAGPVGWGSSDPGGIFSSDGSAAGTGLNVLTGNNWLTNYSDFGVRFKTTDDQSKGYFYKVSGSGSGYPNGQFKTVDSVGVSDGTASGTKVLFTDVSNGYLPGNFVTVVGNQLIMAGGNYDFSAGGKVLVSDGTVAGTTLQTTPYAVMGQTNPSNYSELIIKGINDPAHQAAWFTASTAPYGSELIRFSYSPGTTPSTVMVKDIYPGSLSGVGDVYNGVAGALLPNGKLVFAAYDDVSSLEPWVSDGTDAGTFLLADLVAGAGGSGPISFTNFGSKVAFSAVSSYGRGLVFTDGTSAGTTVLDVNPSGSANPIILGQANGLLYFTATTGDYSTPLQGIYSTNGTTFTHLADINSSASLLGWNASKAYFNVSDATHGAELWAADLVNGGFALVKDILPGSGSALGQSYTTNATMVGDKLVFNAYTSATQQNLFVSDGTGAGTVQLSSNLPTITKVLGSTLVFATTDGIYGVDVAASATPSAIKLVSGTASGTYGDLFGTSPTASLMQTDADQVFFKTSNGDLYATNGSTSGTIKLAGAVENFKVVAENAIFFVQDSATTDASLWYSDGTSAGTRFVEALPANFSYDLDNAVAITTVGVMG